MASSCWVRWDLKAFVMVSQVSVFVHLTNHLIYSGISLMPPTYQNPLNKKCIVPDFKRGIFIQLLAAQSLNFPFVFSVPEPPWTSSTESPIAKGRKRY